MKNCSFKYFIELSRKNKETLNDKETTREYYNKVKRDKTLKFYNFFCRYY